MIKLAKTCSLGLGADLIAGNEQTFNFAPTEGFTYVIVTASSGGTFRVRTGGTAAGATPTTIDESAAGCIPSGGGSVTFPWRDGFNQVSVRALSANLVDLMVTVSHGVTEPTAPRSSAI